MHPVVAVYATFLNRAFDQVLLDVAMHKLPVTFVLDRAGITGPDGPSHYGIWDMAVFGVVPGLRIAAPRDAATLREELREAVGDRRRPDDRALPDRCGRRRTCRRCAASAASTCSAEARARKDVLLVAVGAFGAPRRGGRRPARRAGLRRHRRRPALGPPGPGRAGRPGRARTGWWSRSRTASAPAASATRSPRRCATPAVGAAARPRRAGGWHPHGTRAEILADLGLTAQDVARQVTGWATSLTGRVPDDERVGAG